jgi:integral membrane protein
MMRTAIGRLRAVMLAEGISYLVLLFVAMPLKYAAGMPFAVRIAGGIHGVLFVFFLGALFQAASDRDWKPSRAALVFAASLIPFANFAIDRRLKEEESATAPNG